MSRRPQNGPTFSKAPPKKRKPMTDEELAARHARGKAQQEEIERQAAKTRSFNKLDAAGKFRALFPEAKLPDKPDPPTILKRR